MEIAVGECGTTSDLLHIGVNLNPVSLLRLACIIDGLARRHDWRWRFGRECGAVAHRNISECAQNTTMDDTPGVAVLFLCKSPITKPEQSAFS